MVQLDTLKRNLETIRGKIAAAAEHSGRESSSVKLVAVTKTQPAETVDMLVSIGITDIGENRPLQAIKKAAEVRSQPAWHMIGHLQRNKARKALHLFRYLHSLDSKRLADTLERECAGMGIILPALLEVNISGEESKRGLTPENVPAILDYLRDLPHIEPHGFMTMAPFTEDEIVIRKTFSGLRKLAEMERGRSGLELSELSMGMSNDYEAAVKEGATMVRIGTALFH